MFAADEPNFVAFDPAVGFVERELAAAEALHFAAHQHDAALERVEHHVIVPRLAVLGDDALVLVDFELSWIFCLSWPPGQHTARPVGVAHHDL